MNYKFSLALLSLAFLSCDKDNDGPTGPTRTELLTSSAWKYDNGGIDQDKNGTVDLTFEMTGVVQPCHLDNTVVFMSNGSGTADEGATKCNIATPQTTAFNWSFTSNETMLHIGGPGLLGFGGSFKVNSITATQLSLSKDTSLVLGGIPFNVSLIANLKH